MEWIRVNQALLNASNCLPSDTQVMRRSSNDVRQRRGTRGPSPLFLLDFRSLRMTLDRTNNSLHRVLAGFGGRFVAQFAQAGAADGADTGQLGAAEVIAEQAHQ